jgi:fatty-acyl-CoA synthase
MLEQTNSQMRLQASESAHWIPTNEVPRTTVGSQLRRAASLVPDRVALVDGCGRLDEDRDDGSIARRWTYAELLELTERLASHLLEELEPGDRIAIWAPNSAEWLHLDLAAALAGLVVVPVNALYRLVEAEYVLRATLPAIVVHGESHRDIDIGATARSLSAQLPCVRRTLGLDELIAEARSVIAEPRMLPSVECEHTAQIQFTSGTTGAPKGVLLHHRGLTSMPAVAVELMDLGDAPVWLNVMPLHHIGGCGLSTMGPIAALGTQVLADRFTAGGALRLIEQERVTVMGSVPTMLLAMLDHPDRAIRDLSSMRVVISGGATVSPELVRTIEQTFGVRFVVAFGQTESHGHIAQTRPDDSDVDKAETVGRPLPHVEVKLVHLVSGDLLPFGQPGEVCTRSPLVMGGYLDDPVATDAAIDADGWLHTGDVCSMDDRGYMTVVGRTKDMIVRGGENISPREIEERLATHPSVAEVAVIGVPDARLGESIAAFVRCRDGLQPTRAELSDWTAAALAAYKVPAHWRFVEALPLTANGKVRKPVLREMWAGS